MRRLGLLLLFSIAAIGAIAGWLDREFRRPYKGYAGTRTLVDIPRGASRRVIAGLLEHSGVVRTRLAFDLWSEWHRRRPLEAGEYLFDRPMTPREIFWMIASGRVYVHTVTIPEGWTMFDIADALEREGLCRREDFLKAAQDASLVRDLAPQARSLEGFLFPATYELTRHMTPEEIATTMVRRFRTVWSRLEPSRSANFPGGLSLQGVVELASLVERETPQTEERGLVASVFYNRLRRRIPLQSDPTVQYALALAGQPARGITPADLKIQSPYNTYLHAGLPPGPIANPGKASLEAALYPEHTGYLYFVANDAGGHFFSRTLAQHNRNVARYRRLLAGDDSKPAPVKRHRGRP